MKSKIRTQLLERRSVLTDKEIQAKSEIIIAKLEELLEFKSAKNILTYVSFNNEVDTHPLIKKYLITKSKSIIVPKVIGERLRLFKITSFSDLKAGKSNILEPVNGEEFVSDKLTISDLILVPGIAFDKEKNRIGYGKGYYDKLLKTTRAKKIALAFDLQIAEKIPAEEHDVQVDKIITEKSIIE
ncbi:TPA: 5-formyltetrahydrofolate cyclo-ligase [Candidatus Woesearchaeota archaeon]|nr:5-formyltetrahydrofolate cyclo-ligase [Candidatus Woesearchaeota archaeon]